MPYIKKDNRAKYDLYIRELKPKTPGDLNYIITKICSNQIKDLSYSEINKIVGVLECAKMEFYRRISVPYEEEKRKENGEVY